MYRLDYQYDEDVTFAGSAGIVGETAAQMCIRDRLRVRIPSEKISDFFTLALDFECTPGAIL